MPKLTLRDLFAVVTIVALAMGWALDHWRQAAEQERLDHALQRQSESHKAEQTKAKKQLRDAARAIEMLVEIEQREQERRDQPSNSK